MLTHLRMLMSILSFMTFNTDPGSDPGQKDPPKDPEDTPDPLKPEDPPADRSTWTPEQWQKEMQRVAAKEKDEGRKAAEREYQQKQEEAERTAALQKQESEGKYEEAKQQLTSERDTAQKERDRALELLKTNVDTQWAELPDAVKATYVGEEDDVLTKTEHMQRMKPVIDQLLAEEKKEEERKNPGNPGNPPPTSKPTTTDEDEEAKRRMRPRL